MKRDLASLAVAGLIVVAAAACTGGGASQAGGAGRSQAATLDLFAGRSSAQYAITAPDPARYQFSVAVKAPVAVDVDVSIRTWYGAIFPSILDSSHDTSVCRVHGAQDVCAELFPFLPAQHAGRWTVIATKRSGPAARVRIVITFAKP